MIRFEKFGPADIELAEQFRPADWYDIRPMFRLYTTSDHCFPVKLFFNDQPAAIGCTIVHHHVAWLAHIIVLPELRGHGLGTIITQKLIDQAKEHHCTTIQLIATELGAPVYKKLGFVTETEYVFYKDIQLKDAGTDKNIVPLSEKYYPQVLQLDIAASKENRRHHLQLFFEDGVAYLNKDQVAGYFLPRWGDGLVIADSPSAGIALLEHRLLTKNQACFPAHNAHALHFYKSIGMEPFKTAPRMRLGAPLHWHPEQLFNRIGGYKG